MATFDPYEVVMLRSLLGELIELLSDQLGASAPPEVESDPFAAIVGQLAPVDPPQDEVLQRLLPSAYVDDEEAAGEFRRFTERGLRSRKIAAAELVLDMLGGRDGPDDLGDPDDPGDPDGFGAPDVLGAPESAAGHDRPDQSDQSERHEPVTVVLGADDAETWLRTLTDLRLAIGTRLGLKEGDDDRWADLPPDEPARQVWSIYAWLGYVQDTLVTSL